MLNADRIRGRRDALRLTQAQVAKRIGQDCPYVSHLENGVRTNVTAEMLEALADALHCSMDYLVGRTDDYRRPPRPRAAAGTAPR